MSVVSNGTSSLGGLNELLDADFDHVEVTKRELEVSSKKSKKPLMNDDEDEDEEIDVEDSEEDYDSPPAKQHSPRKSTPTATYYSSPRRRTRSCAVPDVLKTKEVVTLDDLMKHNILRPGYTLEFSGLGDRIETGILVKDGWIEYGIDKYPDMDAWALRVFKEHKRRRKSVDCWETVSTRHHALSYYRDQFLNMMDNRANYPEKKKRLREEKRKQIMHDKVRHAVPGRNRLVQQESTQEETRNGGGDVGGNGEGEDEEVLIDDEPTSDKQIVLPHKKRKLSYGNELPPQEKSSNSSSVDLLADVSMPNALEREETELLDPEEIPKTTGDKTTFTTWLGRKKNDKPTSPQQPEPTHTPPTRTPSNESTTHTSPPHTLPRSPTHSTSPPHSPRTPTPLKRRRTESQAQEQDEDDAPISRQRSTTDHDEAERQQQQLQREEDQRREQEVEEEGREEDQTHDSLEQARGDTQDLVHPDSPQRQPLVLISHQPSFNSSAATTATPSSSSSDLPPWHRSTTDVKPPEPTHTTLDDSDLGSFAARLDEHEKEVEFLTTKKASQTNQNASKSPPTKPDPTNLTPTLPTKATAKPTPNIPIPATEKPTPSKPTPTFTTPSTPNRIHPPLFTAPPASPFSTSSSASVSPITTPTTPATPSTPATPTTPITPTIPTRTTTTTTTTTSNPQRKSAPSVVFTPAKSRPSPTLHPIPSSSKDGKDRTILTTGLRSEMLCTLQALIAQLGGRSVDEFDDAHGARVTHVIAGLTDDAQRAQRTLKYCCGVLCGAWIVSFEWVLASLAAREWVEEGDYELRGDTHGAGAPKKARIAMRKGSPRLFEGLRFCFAGDFVQPSRKDLQRVSRVGGADVLATLPTSTTTMNEYLEEVKHTHVMIDPDRTDAAAAQEIHMVCGLVPLSYHWVLDSVSHYALQPLDRYRVFVQENGRGYETQQSLEF